MTKSKPDQMLEARALVERLRSWTTDWDGSKMVPGEPPRDGLHCDVIDAAAAALTAALDEIERLREALLDATANLAGAASAYRTFARRHPSQGNGEVDALFSTRAADFDKAVERARAALIGVINFV